MPAYETMFGELLFQLRNESVRQEIGELIAGGRSLAEIVASLELAPSPGQLDFIASTPRSLQAAILAVVKDNLDRGDEAKQMMFTWAPGYDWELRLWESTSSVVSDGGITVQVRSRYPGDAHPGIHVP